MVFVYKMKSRSSDNIIYAKFLFNFVIQGNLWMISTFLFWKKKTNPFTIKL